MSVPKAAALLVAVTAALNARAERGAEKGETSRALRPAAPASRALTVLLLDLERLLEKASQYLVTSFMEFDAVDVSPRSVWVTLPVEVRLAWPVSARADVVAGGARGARVAAAARRLRELGVRCVPRLGAPRLRHAQAPRTHAAPTHPLSLPAAQLPHVRCICSVPYAP